MEIQNTWEIDDLAEYAALLLGKSQDEDGLRWVYRGQRLAWELLPKIDRDHYQEHRAGEWSRQEHEKFLIEEFERVSRPYLKDGFSSRWELLAIAQHHGLATRLLDWTFNPLIALFFAVEGPSSEKHSVVWAYKHGGAYADPKRHPDPLDLQEAVFFVPPHITERIPVQNSCFTAHPASKTDGYPYWLGDHKKILIKPSSRSRLWLELRDLGISRASLFPGLDGVCDYVNSLFVEKEYY